MMDMNNGILKVVKSLAAKKYRDDEGLFVAEGTKCVRDTWQHFNCRWLIAKRSWYDQCGTAEHYDKIVFANSQQMARISQFDNPSDVIAVYEKPVDTIDTGRVAASLNIARHFTAADIAARGHAAVNVLTAYIALGADAAAYLALNVHVKVALHVQRIALIVQHDLPAAASFLLPDQLMADKEHRVQRVVVRPGKLYTCAGSGLRRGDQHRRALLNFRRHIQFLFSLLRLLKRFLFRLHRRAAEELVE